jgi:mxaJ protein
MSRTVRAWAAALAAAYAASVVTAVVVNAAVVNASSQTRALPAPGVNILRVCGDPENLPYSNDKLQGFENRIAAVIAADLGIEPTYMWWPHQRGLVKNTLEAGKCDVIFGVPHDLESVLATKPYYRSSYVIAHVKGRVPGVTSLDAPDLKTLRIGVYANTPVEESLARRGLLDHLTAYSLFFDPAGDRDRPAKLLDDLVAGKVDVAIPWGPLAGYYAKKLNAPIEMTVLPDETGVPLSFSMSMGVKKGNRDLKNRLEAAIDHRQAEIRSVLEEFGVPLAAEPAAAAAVSAQNQQPQEQPPAPAPAQSDASAPPDFKKLNPFTDNSEGIAAGKKLYIQVGCQGCHGGGGGGGMAASLIDDSWRFGSDDETLFKLIKGQIPEQTMPTVYSMLPDEQVWQILAFIRTLYIGDPAKKNW